MSRTAALASIIAASIATSAVALAEDGTEAVDEARRTVVEAADLLDAKRYAEALDRATRAESLYHAPIHLLLIAQAEEGLEHLANAAKWYLALPGGSLRLDDWPSAPQWASVAACLIAC